MTLLTIALVTMIIARNVGFDRVLERFAEIDMHRGVPRREPDRLPARGDRLVVLARLGEGDAHESGLADLLLAGGRVDGLGEQSTATVVVNVNGIDAPPLPPVDDRPHIDVVVATTTLWQPAVLEEEGAVIVEVPRAVEAHLRDRNASEM